MILDSLPAKRGNVSGGALVGGARCGKAGGVLFLALKMSQIGRRSYSEPSSPPLPAIYAVRRIVPSSSSVEVMIGAVEKSGFAATGSNTVNTARPVTGATGQS